jgi:speckle-type POZ protein
MSSKSLLSAAGAQSSLRSASGVVATSVRGFHVLRVDGFSVTTSLPGGECLTSDPFYVGGRCWYIDYYPNGADGGKDTSDAIALYLRLEGSNKKERVRADYKFSLLDNAGTAAYELPAETGIFKPATPAVNHNVYGYGGRGGHNSVVAGDGGGGEEEGHPDRCGYDAFITKEDLERRRNILLREDSLAVRCDVAVAVLETMPIAPEQTNDARAPPPGRGRGRRSGRWRGYVNPAGYGVDYNASLDEYDDGGDVKPPQSDAEYIRRCLGGHQR